MQNEPIMRAGKPSKRFTVYAKPEIHPFALHDFSRVVPLARSGGGSSAGKPPKGVAKSTTSPPKKRRLFGMLPPKNSGTGGAKKRSANGRSVDLSPSNLGRGVPVVENDKKSATLSDLGNLRNLGALVGRTKKRLQSEGMIIENSPMAKGSYGTIFAGKLDGQSGVRAFLGASATRRVGDPKELPPRSALAIKVQVIGDAMDLKNVEREARIHAFVSRRAPLIVPKFFFAGYFKETRTYVTMMEHIDGRGLCSSPAIGPRQFLTLEKMIGMLWRLRVFHGDLHCNNILVPRRGGFKIIDFGRAIVLPGSIAPKTATEAMRPEVQDAMQAYAARVVARRSREGNAGYGVLRGYVPVQDKVQYADDVHALRVLYSRMDAIHRARLRPGVSAPQAGRGVSAPRLSAAAVPRGARSSVRSRLLEPLWPRARGAGVARKSSKSA